jgi:hypothetical protein
MSHDFPARIPLDALTFAQVETVILRLELAQSRVREAELAGQLLIYNLILAAGVPPADCPLYRVDLVGHQLVRQMPQE